MNIVIKRIFIFLGIAGLLVVGISTSHADDALDNQAWLSSYLNFNLPHDRLFFNQDVSLMQSLESERFTRIFLRSQINYQISGSFSIHGGLAFLFTYERSESDLIEVRPWVGAKLRWPNFWRFNFVQYLRTEERFIYETEPGEWITNFRLRYKIGSKIPINRPSLSNNTIYGMLGYEVFGNSMNTSEFEERPIGFHRFEAGMGYQFTHRTRLEVMFMELLSFEETADKYDPSDFIVQLRFRKYFGFD